MLSRALHRPTIIAFVAATLYGGAPALASQAVTAPARTPQPLDAPQPLGPSISGGERAPSGKPSEPSASQAAPKPLGKPADGKGDTGVPHIALLLPLESPSFARHAEAVKNGFLAAAKVQGRAPLPLRIYPVNDDDGAVVEKYRQALENGARMIVGPLTRSGVSAVANSAFVMVPTVALNVPDHRVAGQHGLYVLSLHAESEARQVAQMAWHEGRQSAVTLHAGTPLFKRIHQAFVEEFKRLGGRIVAEYPFTADQGELARIKKGAAQGGVDMVFLALDFPRARLARAWFGALPLYATSHIYPGSVDPLAGFDLANVRFLDMPWLLQPEHPAVMVYPRVDHRDADLDRFYALGIDAFRIVQELASGKVEISLDGVIGRLKLGADHHFERTLTGAQFDGGKLKISGEARDQR